MIFPQVYGAITDKEKLYRYIFKLQNKFTVTLLLKSSKWTDQLLCIIFAYEIKLLKIYSLSKF